jgi:hypothetical protein
MLSRQCSGIGFPSHKCLIPGPEIVGKGLSPVRSTRGRALRRPCWDGSQSRYCRGRASRRPWSTGSQGRRKARPLRKPLLNWTVLGLSLPPYSSIYKLDPESPHHTAGKRRFMWLNDLIERHSHRSLIPSFPLYYQSLVFI